MAEVVSFGHSAPAPPPVRLGGRPAPAPGGSLGAATPTGASRGVAAGVGPAGVQGPEGALASAGSRLAGSSLVPPSVSPLAQGQTDNGEGQHFEPSVSSLVDLGGRRLSILQDKPTQRFVYRGLNKVTREVERQIPTDDELERIAFLRKLSGRNIDKVI